MTHDERATEFAVFAIEHTAERLSREGDEVYRAIDALGGVESFLYASYDALHTQSKDYIVDEVVQYLTEHHSPIVTRKGGKG